MQSGGRSGNIKKEEDWEGEVGGRVGLLRRAEEGGGGWWGGEESGAVKDVEVEAGRGGEGSRAVGLLWPQLHLTDPQAPQSC